MGDEYSTFYTAQFREEYKHLVTFDANGGTGTMDTDTFYASEGAYTLPPCGFTATEGHVFKDWTVSWKNNLGGTSTFDYMAGSGLSGLTGDLTVSANWIELALKASPAAAGSAEYANGAFTATANPGYTFDHWEYANDEFSVAPVGTVWPTANPYEPPEVDYKIYTAVFTTNQYALAIPDDIPNGTVVKYSGTPKTGNTIKLTVTPDEGCWLDSLSYTPEGGAPVAIDETDKNGRYVFTMPPANVTVNAVFALPAPAFGIPDFTLPAFLTTVEEAAFVGIAASVVDVPESCISIGAHAFKDCANLTQIRLPANCEIDVSAFTGCGTVYVYAPAGGTTEEACAAIPNCVFTAEE